MHGQDTGPVEILVRRRMRCFRLAAMALSTMCGLFMAEIALRLAGYSPSYVSAMGSFHEADEVSGHRGKRNFSGRFSGPAYDCRIVHNEHGFRRQEYQNPESASSRGYTFMVIPLSGDGESSRGRFLPIR